MHDDDEPKVSSEDFGYGSPIWMMKAALLGATPHGLYHGVCEMLTYIDAHIRHVEKGEDCDGPDFWTACDILVQTSLTGRYIETVDPEDMDEDEPIYDVLRWK